MKLHWSPRSPYVRKVMIAAHETGFAGEIELQRSVVAMSSCNAGLMPDNPLNKIPTLVLDDGRILFDSSVIMEYFDMEAGGGRLIPTDRQQRLEVLRLHALGHGLIDLTILLRNERDRPKEMISQPLMESFAAKRDATLDRLEQEVSGFAKMPFNIGHIAIGCALGYTDFRFAYVPWREGRPGLADWHAAFQARPSARATAFADG